MSNADNRDHDPGPATDPAAPMELLQAGVPLSLLIDLTRPDGPDSPELLADEVVQDSVWYRTPRIPRGDC